MKNITLILTAFFASLSIESQAQTKNGRVLGTVIDGNTKTIESATITLLKAKDSSVFKMGVADKTGKFSFEGLEEGSYLVSVSAVGHQKGYSETFTIAGEVSAVTLKTIELIPAEKSLGGVTVTARKPHHRERGSQCHQRGYHGHGSVGEITGSVG
jgi:iron complex outermembrane receptor protein